MKKALQLSVLEGSPAISIELPGQAGRASAELTKHGDAVVRLQDSRGAIVMQLRVESAPKETRSKAPSKTAGSKRGPKPMSRKQRKERALENLKSRLQSGRKVPVLRVLAKAWKVDTSTASTWISTWERQGLIPKRKRDGVRRVFVAPRSVNGHANGHANGIHLHS